MSKIYECDICGAVALNRDLVCGTRPVEDTEACCGKPAALEEMSDKMKEHLSHVCGGCGRLVK